MISWRDCWLAFFVPLALCSAIAQGAETSAQPARKGSPTTENTPPRSAGTSSAVPSTEARQAAARALLELLDRNFSSNRINYHFNASGDSVCWATAGLAFIASGSTFKAGPYQKSLKVVFDKLQKVMDREEFTHQPVWGCAQATVFLAELHRTAPTAERAPIRSLMEKYVAKLEKSQTSRGGWCHTFEDKKNELNYDDLMATTVMALQGLGMARREGLTVDQKVIDLGLKYIDNSSDEKRGHIGYSPREGQKGMPGPGRSAGGLLALSACGQGRSPLAKAAGSRLIDSFIDRPMKDRPQAALNSGHACAQMGQAWAAWWAAENNCYDKFWAGQGALIMARKKETGEFRPGPTDGKEEEAAAEKGDFANAMHALMFVVAEGRLATGAPKSRIGPAQVADAIDEAALLVDEWGAAAPASLKEFAALSATAKRPPAAELTTRLTSAIKELAKLPADKSGPAIMRLLGLTLDVKGAVRPVFQSSSSTLQVTLTSSTVRVAGLVKAKVQLKANDAFLSANPPAMPALAPIVANTTQSTATVLLKPGQKAPAALDVEVEWDLCGLKFPQVLPVPLK